MKHLFEGLRPSRFCDAEVVEAACAVVRESRARSKSLVWVFPVLTLWNDAAMATVA